MEALSLDLRRRIVARYKQGDLTYAEVAALFDVGEASVSRLMRRARERDDLERAPGAGGFPPRITDDQLQLLVQLVAEKPDRTLPELCDAWMDRYGGDLTRSSLGRALRRAGVTRKKSPSDPPSRIASTSKKNVARSSKKPQP